MDTNYNGVVPDYKYFSNVSVHDYNNYKDLFKNKDWK
jgi:hypothetical protein